MNKKIYLLFTQTNTVLTNIIKLYTGAPYNHVSISFDRELRELYSFGRKNPANPLIGGFVKEDIVNGLFAYSETKCMVCSIDVTEQMYMKMKERIHAFQNEKDKYRYNFLGLFGFMLDWEYERPYAYFCSQFVATVLRSGGIAVSHKPPTLTAPEDIRHFPLLTLEYEGTVSGYIKHINEYEQHNRLWNHIDFTTIRAVENRRYA